MTISSINDKIILVNKHKLIGTTEYVRLPGIGKAKYLSAKIDTGADSSSIWASDIKQEENTLYYKLFAPGSAYYSGKLHKTDRFKITSVKSSFGHEEIRYKVRLRIEIGEIIYTSWFTLADRSRNSYPILIGKNFLKNRFVVDVSRNYLQSTDTGIKRVLVITAQPKKMSEFLQKAKKRNNLQVAYETVNFKDILFDINGYATKVANTADGCRDVSDYSLAYIKSHWNYPEQASTLAEYLLYKSKPFFDQELRNYTSRSKLSEYMKLATHGIDIPRSFAGYPQLLKKQMGKITGVIGFPMVFKAAEADRGRDNYFVEDEATLNKLIDEVPEKSIYIIQAFVPNDGFYRINVFGKDAKMAVFRSKCEHEDPLKQHLSKPSGGSNAKIIPIEDLVPEIMQLAVRASIYMKREIAGVDVIQDKSTGKCYILEVNSSPQLRSGAYIEEKATEFARFIDKELKR